MNLVDIAFWRSADMDSATYDGVVSGKHESVLLLYFLVTIVSFSRSSLNVPDRFLEEKR